MGGGDGETAVAPIWINTSIRWGCACVFLHIDLVCFEMVRGIKPVGGALGSSFRRLLSRVSGSIPNISPSLACCSMFSPSTVRCLHFVSRARVGESWRCTSVLEHFWRSLRDILVRREAAVTDLFFEGWLSSTGFDAFVCRKFRSVGGTRGSDLIGEKSVILASLDTRTLGVPHPRRLPAVEKSSNRGLRGHATRCLSMGLARTEKVALLASVFVVVGSMPFLCERFAIRLPLSVKLDGRSFLHLGKPSSSRG